MPISFLVSWCVRRLTLPSLATRPGNASKPGHLTSQSAPVRVGFSAWLGGAIFGACDLFHGGDMQCGKGNTPSIIEPDYDTIASRVYSGVIRTRNIVTVTATRHNR